MHARTPIHLIDENIMLESNVVCAKQKEYKSNDDSGCDDDHDEIVSFDRCQTLILCRHMIEVCFFMNVYAVFVPLIEHEWSMSLTRMQANKHPYTMVQQHSGTVQALFWFKSFQMHTVASAVCVILGHVLNYMQTIHTLQLQFLLSSFEYFEIQIRSCKLSVDRSSGYSYMVTKAIHLTLRSSFAAILRSIYERIIWKFRLSAILISLTIAVFSLFC